MVKWEYIEVEVPDKYYRDCITFLNEFGENGWEFTGHTADTGFATLYLMKRIKTND